ncbi:MAG: DUF5367 family protein [Dokdonia sp.]|jgi:hypothetical protein
MKITRTLGFGLLIWVIGVMLYALSFYVPILENAEQQANLWLSIVIIPVVWFGAKLYYKKGVKTNGILVGTVFFLIAGILDALITVPYTVLPYGGTYADFFINFGFWFIGLEFIATTSLYWFFNVWKKGHSTHLV